MNNLDGTDHWLPDYYDSQEKPTIEEQEQSYNTNEWLHKAEYEDSL